MNQLVNFSHIPSSAYVHIPFCRRRCFYCDFPISVLGDKLRGETSGSIQKYVEVLCQEIATMDNFGQSLTTIFFGGGTPSLLSTQQLERILTRLEESFGIASGAEISMEMDPGTFDLQHLQGYVNAGVNRISLGVQAFDDKLLKTCGRSHSVNDILAAVDLLALVGVPEFSIDLISGLPHQTVDMWHDFLRKAINLHPSHISIYDLTIEPGTAFGRYYQPGSQPLPSDESTVQMYKIAHETLTQACYEHYEISNYAQIGHQCSHNRVYWENRSYYGFGMGAASYIGGKRFNRPRKTKEYYAWVENGAIIDCEVTPPDETLFDTLMLGLRLAEGLNLDVLSQRFGGDKVKVICHTLQTYVDKNWLEIKENKLRLLPPDGFLFSNVILSTLFNISFDV
ncbi:MAG: radical SAM family heme chaperone HemW [Cyanobacteria bacterium P01_A01_bin.84]